MIHLLIFNELQSLSATTAILEAADWDESVASSISRIIKETKPSSDLEIAKANLRERLEEEKISKNIIDKIFMLIAIEESNMKAKGFTWDGLILKMLEI